MGVKIDAIKMKKNPLYSSSVVKSGILDFKGRSVSIFNMHRPV
ncbi:MAG: hypothetical protein QME45_09835 [Clostridiales bacterium]|nr:hypothetical protein [Clostridiales bacterium]